MTVALLAFTFELRAPLVVPGPRSRPDHVETLDAAPGSALRGGVLTALTAAGHHALVADLLASARFLPAVPCLHDTRSVPVAVSRRCRRTEPHQSVDVLLDDDEDDPPSRVPPQRWWGGPATATDATPATRTDIHIQRAADRRKGRPIDKSGAMFSYASVVRGTTYHGAIVGETNLLNRTSQALEGLVVPLGTAANTGYGGRGRALCLPVTTRELETLLTYRPPGTPQVDDDPVDVGVLLTSDAIVTNGYGTADPLALVDALATRFGAIGVTLADPIAAVRPGVVGGYSARAGRATQAVRVARSGSVVWCQLSRHLTAAELSALELGGVGRGWLEGFGAFVVLAPIARAQQAIASAGNPTAPRPLTAPPAVVALDARILDARRAAVGGEIARILLSDVACVVSRSLVGRLRSAARAVPRTALAEQLAAQVRSFRPKAADPLQRQHVGTSTLWRVLTEPKLDGVVDDAVRHRAGVDGLHRALVVDGQPNADATEALVPEILVALLDQLGTMAKRAAGG